MGIPLTVLVVVGVGSPALGLFVAPLVPLLGRRQVGKNLRRLERRIASGIGPTENVPTPD